MLIPVHKLTLSKLLQFAFDTAKYEYEKGTPYPHGVCSILDEIEARVYQVRYSDIEIIKDRFVEWPKTSGNEVYPVPGVLGQSELSSYLKYKDYDWDPSHPYGKLRYEMIEWTINKLREEECSTQV